MAFFLIAQWRLLPLLVIGLSCFSHRTKPFFIAAEKTPSPFNFKASESLVKLELEALTEADLQKEAKLSRVEGAVGGSNYFYPFGKIKRRHKLFSWTSGNKSESVDVIVIGASDGGNINEWMSGTFIALRKVEENTTSTTSRNVTDYYALIAYVRKDSNGLAIEWDKWSSEIVISLTTRENEWEASDTFSVDTFLCSYGTCSCAACECTTNGRIQNEKTSSTPADDDGGLRKSGNRVPDLSKSAMNRKFADDKASAFGFSKTGNTHTSAVAKGKGGAQSAAISDSGIAVAESQVTKSGQSLAISTGRKMSVSEATSGTGDAKSLATSKSGIAQASSQSRGGLVQTQAIGSGKEEYNYYDDDIPEDGADLVEDTDKMFSQVHERSQTAKIRARSSTMSDEMCNNEYAINNKLRTDEQANLRKKENPADKPLDGGSKLLQNPLHYGIDIDLGVNTSIIVASKLEGYDYPRKSCCNLDAKPSIIVDLLKTMNQNCNPDLGPQIKKLQINLDKHGLQNIMQTKKLTPSKSKNLVSLLLVNMYQDPSTSRAMKILKEATNGSTSDNINLIAAVIVNAAHYAVTEGHYHFVKVVKGLESNVRTVWTGIMLEFKRCKADVSICAVSHLERLRAEKRVILSLYLFLRFVDYRYSPGLFAGGDPIEAFVDFYTLHSESVSKLAYCKSMKVLLYASTPGLLLQK